MQRLLAITAVLAALALLLVAMGALAQDPDQWPPAEVTTQPRPPTPVSDRGPMPVNPEPPVVTASLPSDITAHWGLMDYATALGGMAGAFFAGITSGMGAYHVSCRKGLLELHRGPMDWEALVARLDRIDSRLEAIPPASLQSPSPRPSSRKSNSRTLAPPSGPEDPP